MAHVFISYVHENQDRVDHLCDELIKRGIEVWLDRNDIAPGTRWKKAIRRAIQQGSFFIACFSRDYYARGKTYMNEELTLAIEELRRRPTDKAWFIPVKLSECEIPDRSIGGGETLQDIQWVDLRKDWEEGIQKVISAIQGALEASTLNLRKIPLSGKNGMDGQIVDQADCNPGLAKLIPESTQFRKAIHREYGIPSEPEDWSVEFIYPGQELPVPSRVVVSQLPKMEGYTYPRKLDHKLRWI